MTWNNTLSCATRPADLGNDSCVDDRTSCPSPITSPPCTSYNSVNLSIVNLPAPDGPTNATILPGVTVNDTCHTPPPPSPLSPSFPSSQPSSYSGESYSNVISSKTISPELLASTSAGRQIKGVASGASQISGMISNSAVTCSIFVNELTSIPYEFLIHNNVPKQLSNIALYQDELSSCFLSLQLLKLLSIILQMFQKLNNEVGTYVACYNEAFSI